LILLVVPEERSNAPFFPGSACNLIFGVPGNPQWHFCDLIGALDSRKRITEVRAATNGHFQ